MRKFGVGLFTIVWFALLGGRSLYDPDEGRYAEIPREMLQIGDWVIPHLNGLIYLEKPPLQYWLTALGFRWLGDSEFAARLCPGIAGYLSLIVIYRLGRRLWGDAAGTRAVLLTAASVLFVLLGHQLTLDMLLSFWLLVSLSCFLSAQLERSKPHRCRAWMLGSWSAMAFAVLTKGLIGVLIPAGSLLLYVLWQNDRPALRALHVRWGLPLFLVIAAPWFVVAARVNTHFLNFFFVREHFLRYLTPIEQRSEPWWFFVPVLTLGILPWSPLAFDAVAHAWQTGEPRGRFDPTRLLWVWSIFIFVFFSLSNAKLITYVLPAVPALALLSARPLPTDGWNIRVGALLSLAACAGIVVYANVRWSSLHTTLLAQHMYLGLSLTAAILAATGAICLVLLLRSPAQKALTALCVGWMLTSGGLLIAGFEAQQFFSAKDAADLLKTVAPAGASIYSVQDYEQSLTFYLQRNVVLVDYRDELALGLDDNPRLGVATLGEFTERWRGSGEAYAIMHDYTYDRLDAQGLPMREIGRIRRRIIVSRH